MKKILILILAMMPLLIVSCKKNNSVKGDEPDNEYAEESIMHIGDVLCCGSSPLVRFQEGQMECISEAIVSVGKVSNLNSINYIPTSGWEKGEIEINVGYGYVIKMYSSHYYCRLRIIEYIDKGGATGYKIRYSFWDPLEE